LLGTVGDAGQDRRHPDGRFDAGVDERFSAPQPLTRMRGRRLGLAPDVLVERGIEKVTDTSARRDASASTSTSRTIIGPRVMMLRTELCASASASRQPRVSR
jgi:hypothetical protein